MLRLGWLRAGVRWSLEAREKGPGFLEFRVALDQSETGEHSGLPKGHEAISGGGGVIFLASPGIAAAEEMRHRRCVGKPPRTRAWPLVLLFALVAAPAAALELRESFDRDWSEPEAATCRSGQRTFVRRIAAGACGEPGTFAWSGGPSVERDAPTCAAENGCEDDRVAIHRFAEFEPGGAFGTANRGVLEVLTTREKQSGVTGRMRVDLHVPDDVPMGGAGEHYLVMHNLALTETDCPRDCSGVLDTATAEGDGADRYRWYGVIGGAFGEPGDTDSPIRAGSIGFAVEVPAKVERPGDRPNDLIDVSFLPYSVGGKGKVFPAGWYRISIERTASDYRYSVERFEKGRFVPIVPDDASEGGRHERSFPARLLAEPLGRPLDPGYVGLTVAWFGGASRVGAQVDWDDLVVDW